VEGALNTIDGYEAMHMIRKDKYAGWKRAMCLGQRAFVHSLFRHSLIDQLQTKLKTFIGSNLFAADPWSSRMR
jgi:hypothetical protein